MSNDDVLTRNSTLQPIAWLKARPWKLAALAGLGGALTICALAYVNGMGVLPLLIAPFGASCVLVFGVSASPFSRPYNVIGGHLVTAFMGLSAAAVFGYGPLGLAFGIGFAIAGMIVTDSVHPPAGANPIVIALAQPHWSFLFLPVLAGAICIVLSGTVYHRFVTRQSYPLRR